MDGTEYSWEHPSRSLLIREFLRKEGVTIKVKRGLSKKVKSDNLALRFTMSKLSSSWKIIYKMDLGLKFTIGVGGWRVAEFVTLKYACLE